MDIKALDRALQELHGDVGKLQIQLEQQKRELSSRVFEISSMAEIDRTVSFGRAVLPKDSMKVILQDIAAFQRKLQDKNLVNDRLAAENERLRAALVTSRKEKESVTEALSRMSNKLADVKAAAGGDKIRDLIEIPVVPKRVSRNASVQTDLPALGPPVHERIEKLVRKEVEALRKSEVVRIPIEVQPEPEPELPLSLVGSKYGQERIRMAQSSRPSSIDRVTQRPKSPAAQIHRVRNYNIRDD